MKKILATISVGLIATVLNAHEFWMRPARFYFSVGEEALIDLVVGENFTGEYWDLSKHRVEKLELFTSAAKRDLTKEVKPGKGKNIRVKMSAAGTHLLALQSNAAFIELEAEKFNAYVEEDGLDNIRERRLKRGETDKPSREFYRRYAKLLLQSGDLTDEVFKRKVGLKHEIIPLNNPAQLKSGDHMECRVLFNNEPAAHQMVKVWSFIGNRIFQQNIYTEKDGTMKFPISNSGPWMVSTVRMEPIQSAEADYESSWASLVFGIK